MHGHRTHTHMYVYTYTQGRERSAEREKDRSSLAREGRWRERHTEGNNERECMCVYASAHARARVRVRGTLNQAAFVASARSLARERERRDSSAHRSSRGTTRPAKVYPKLFCSECRCRSFLLPFLPFAHTRSSFFPSFLFPFIFFPSLSLSALVRRSSLFSKRHEPESVRELCSLPFLLRYERRN